jgi:hypothetical protein
MGALADAPPLAPPLLGPAARDFVAGATAGVAR